MADITSGLVAYWKMDDGSGTTVTDSSGNGHHGTFIGSPIWVAGKYGGGLKGNNSGFEAVFNFSPTNFTVAYWIYPTKVDDLQSAVGANGCYWGGFVSTAVSGGGAYIGTDMGTRIGPTANDTYVVNQWIHIVFTYNAGVGNFYKNGVLIASKSGMKAPVAWTKFGNINGSNSLQAILDEVCIYSRALSQDDVTALYYNLSPTLANNISPISSITYDTAQVNSRVYSPNTITYGVCYSETNTLPTLADSYTVEGTLTNTYTSFISQLTGLNASTQYYVRTYATESGGTTYYSDVQVFKTLQFGIILNSLAISIDKGTIPPMNKVPFSLMNLAISIDKGIIPPKNYFKSQINTLAISLDKADESILTYQIL
jgi:hypothetical protein